jgi:hypothetical protein
MIFFLTFLLNLIILKEINMQPTMDPSDGSAIFSMDPTLNSSNYAYYLDSWKTNIDLIVTQNKAPFGIYLHYFWFYNSTG